MAGPFADLRKRFRSVVLVADTVEGRRLIFDVTTGAAAKTEDIPPSKR
jgi:hypothetical protein